MRANALAQALLLPAHDLLRRFRAAGRNARPSTGHFEETTNRGNAHIAFHRALHSKRLEGATDRVVYRVDTDPALLGNLAVRLARRG